MLLPIIPLFLVIFVYCGGGGGGDGGDATNGSAPIATSLSATSVSETSATLSGTINPNGLPTQAWLEYGTDSGLGTYTSSPKQDVGNGLNTQAINTTLNGLATGTRYYFRFCAENSKGYSEGQIINFTTSSPGSPPTVTTLAATSVGANTATLNGNVTANGLATNGWFEWGTNSSLSSFTSTSSQSVGSGTTSQSVNAALTGLNSGATY